MIGPKWASVVKHQRIYKKIISDIENELNEIENLPHTLMDMNRKRDLESRLNNFYGETARGAQIRSRAKWISENENPTKFFLGLKKASDT